MIFSPSTRRHETPWCARTTLQILQSSFTFDPHPYSQGSRQTFTIVPPYTQATAPMELVPSVFDRMAAEQPHQPWAAVPIGVDLASGTRDISWLAAANAINRAAWFLHACLGTAEPSTFPTVAYRGSSDLRHIFLAVALMKLEHEALLFHSSLSLEGQNNLISTRNCNIFLHDKRHSFHPSSLPPSARTFTAPSIAMLLKEGDVKPFPDNEPSPTVFLILGSSCTLREFATASSPTASQ